MGNRRVGSLTYRLETDDAVSFDADPVEHETDAFSVRLEEDELTVDLDEHFSSVEEARERVDPFLEAWEVKYGLQFRQREISFSYEDAEVVREDTGDEKVILKAKGKASASGRAAPHVTRGKYPDPPDKFRLSPDARTLWTRYESYEEGRERLFAMGYACLKFLEGRAGGRREAAKRYSVEYEVFDDLGRLTSTRGGPDVARKPSDSRGEATPEERKWIEQAIRKIVRQVGVSDAGHHPETLTKDDLPPLPW
jgi:hypothetical protein